MKFNNPEIGVVVLRRFFIVGRAAGIYNSAIPQLEGIAMNRRELLKAMLSMPAVADLGMLASKIKRQQG